MISSPNHSFRVFLKKALPVPVTRRLVAIRQRFGVYLTSAAALSRLGSEHWFPPMAVSKPSHRFPFLTVGIISDEFSYLGWSREFNSIFIKPDDGDLINTIRRCHFLLVEPTWKGLGGEWRGRFVVNRVPSADLLKIFDSARRLGVPVVFWNKEDPTHFDDYLEVARAADFIFTTASELVPVYKRRLAHNRVFDLPFAVSPDLHNPALQQTARRLPLFGARKLPMHRGSVRGRPIDVAFAGTFFTQRLSQRGVNLRKLLDAGLELTTTWSHWAGRASYNGRVFVIWSRQEGDSKYQFPSKYQGFLAPSLSYRQMLSAYRAVKVMLNVNTVVDSPTMFSRRAIEAIACGAAVVSGPSKALPRIFSQEQLPLTEDTASAKAWIKHYLEDEDQRTRSVHQAQRALWRSHTYAHRVRRITRVISTEGFLEDSSEELGASSPTPQFAPELDAVPKISVVTSSCRPAYVDNVVNNVARQSWPEVELIYVAHSTGKSGAGKHESSDSSVGSSVECQISETRFATLCHEAGITQFQYLRAGSGETLGQALNRAILKASGRYVAKFDDDDIYWDHYLEDSFNALRFSRADVVGKKATYVWLGAEKKMILRNEEAEHAWVTSVSGATLFADVETFRRYRFSHLNRGEDTDFLERILIGGGRIYSADRFNFVLNRHTDHHAWKAADQEFLRDGRLVSSHLDSAVAEA